MSRSDLADVSVTVAHPNILQVVVVQAYCRGGTRELQPGPGLPDWDEGEEVRRRSRFTLP